MKLTHEFTVPASVEEAWGVLLDIERIGPCMPGATITSVDADAFEGSVKVKVGPMRVVYRGTAQFLERDEANRRVVVQAQGKESRGTGTAKAIVTAVLEGQGERTKVTVDTDLDITGKPAQLGRGLMDEVGQKLIARFAESLAAEIGGPVTAAPGNDSPADSSASVTQAAPQEDDVLDLLSVGAGPVIRRALPVVAAALVVTIVWRLARRSR